MALDEPKDTDHVFDIDGFKYIVDKEFMEKTKPIKIDFSGMGFKLDVNYTKSVFNQGQHYAVLPFFYGFERNYL